MRARARFMDLAWDMLAERRGRKDPWEWAGVAQQGDPAKGTSLDARGHFVTEEMLPFPAGRDKRWLFSRLGDPVPTGPSRSTLRAPQVARGSAVGAARRAEALRAAPALGVRARRGAGALRGAAVRPAGSGGAEPSSGATA